jgi:SAM-dependent methyltransferase
VDQGVDVDRFFDAHPRFLETSKTGPALARLNARYKVLLRENRHLIDGARVLDVASHDGRFSFAALRTGATEVVGIEHDPELVRHAVSHMQAYGIDPARYRFECRDLFRGFADLGTFDVVLCFGILYHVNDHLHLLSSIAEVEPKVVLIDSHVSQLDGAVIELRSPLGQSPPQPGNQLEGHPTRAALDALISSLGWCGRYLDWSAMAGTDGLQDYQEGRRVSLLATCPDRIPEDVRRQAVDLVFEFQREPRWQWMAIRGVSEHFGLNPQALRMWVRKAERELDRIGEV